MAEKYYTDCDCWADHWRVFDTLELAEKDFNKRECKRKIMYRINSLGRLIDIKEVIEGKEVKV